MAGTWSVLCPTPVPVKKVTLDTTVISVRRSRTGEKKSAFPLRPL